jgi:hypothetical protein
VWADRREGWYRWTVSQIFCFLKIQENFPPSSPVNLVPEKNRIMCLKG